MFNFVYIFFAKLDVFVAQEAIKEEAHIVLKSLPEKQADKIQFPIEIFICDREHLFSFHFFANSTS